MSIFYESKPSVPPLGGNVSQYEEYMFETLLGTGVATATAQTITGITNRFKRASVGMSGGVK